ncbi:hypothetical protein KSS87_003294 [Heliosperma pusillum]|nr:hypothetical protein KSS87_003294 [Heliosperma pusillum]
MQIINVPIYSSLIPRNIEAKRIVHNIKQVTLYKL